MMSASRIGRSWDALRPELAAGVSVDPPLKAGAPWVIAVAEVPRARVGADFARLAGLFDGRRSLREAVLAAGIAEDAAQAFGVVDTLAAAGMLRPASLDETDGTRGSEGARRGIRRSWTRFRYRAPLTFQWVLVDPSSLAGVLARPFRIRGVVATSMAGVLALLAIAAVSVTIHSAAILGALAAPLPVDLFPALLLAIVSTGCLHELSHAVTLATMGGRPTRMGIMLLYLMPAFFCDVTDGWRIGERWRRAAVALAGPALHLVLAAASFALLLLVASSAVRVFLILYGSACTVAVVANLIPFLKLDGYLALVAITDTPYLRANAVEAARRASARLLFGEAARRDTEREPVALVGFGMLCVLFPIVLFVWAAIRLQPVFLEMGLWMALTYLMLLVSFLTATAWRIARFIAKSRPARARIARTAAGAGAVLVLVALALLAPVRVIVHAGYMVRDEGVFLVSTTESVLRPVHPGDPVRLLSNGIVLRPGIGAAVVAGSGRDTEVALAALVPVSGPSAAIAGWGIRLGDVESPGRLPSVGAAEVDTGRDLPAGALLLELAVQQPLRAVFGERTP